MKSVFKDKADYDKHCEFIGRPINKGRIACRESASYEDNPYNEGTEGHKDWIEGYMLAYNRIMSRGGY